MTDLLSTEWIADKRGYYFYSCGSVCKSLPEQSSCYVKEYREKFIPDVSCKELPPISYEKIEDAKALAIFSFYLPGYCLPVPRFDYNQFIKESVQKNILKTRAASVGQIGLFA